VFFNHPNGRNGIIDMFFQERYLNAIQTACPHVLRYLSAAVITNRRRRNILKDLVRAIHTEAHTYSDPITRFLDCLYGRCDFDGAQAQLRECETLLANDFFLVACKDEFLENARLCVFEAYCRIHSCIDLRMLAQKLCLEQEAAEHWIVNLIRNAHLDAKIDSAANQVVLGTRTPSVYQLCIEKTKTLSFRTYMMSNNLNKLAQAQ
jgi:translation initiation factor 3 subunit E